MLHADTTIAHYKLRLCLPDIIRCIRIIFDNELELPNLHHEEVHYHADHPLQVSGRMSLHNVFAFTCDPQRSCSLYDTHLSYVIFTWQVTYT